MGVAMTKSGGGDVLIKNSYVKIDNEFAYRIFEIEAPEDGDYYLNTWMMVPLTKDGYKEFQVQINNDKSSIKIKPGKDGWQSIKQNDNLKTSEKVKLIKGLNTISISTTLPDVPEVEFIKLTKDIKKAEISEEKYVAYVAKIKDNMITRSKTLVKKDSIESKLKSYVIDTKGGNYYAVMDVNYNYTYNTSFYFTAGTRVTFATSITIPYVPYDPVIELFNESNPEGGGSWVTYNSTLTATIGTTGAYRLRLRPFYQNTSGVVSLYKDGVLYSNNCPVAGAIIGYTHQTPTTYNYFTTNVTQDTKLWIEDGNSLPGKIVAYNDDYYGGAFSWGVASRIKKDFSVVIRGIHVTSFGSNTPTGTCDVYIKCENSNITGSFPNLKADDAIKSAAPSDYYNCASWAGGITSGWFWGCLAPSRTSTSCTGLYYGSAGMWLTWDGYLGNSPYLRYAGATTYTRDGADASNGVVALWSNNGNISGATHLSVKKPGNNDPHGYDWESKPGSLMRTFHPRDALNGGSYGSILQYYRIATSLKSGQNKELLTLEESLSKGLTVLPKVTLDATEKGLIEQLALKRKDNFKLDDLYDKWITSCKSPEMAIYSNPLIYLENAEGKAFMDYCLKHQDDAYPFFMEKLFSLEDGTFESQFTSFMFCGFNGVKDTTLMDEVKKEWKQKNFNKDGAYIVPNDVANTKNFIKKLLNKNSFIEKKLEKSSSDLNDEGAMENDNLDYYSFYPNPLKTVGTLRFKLDKTAPITLSIYDMNGTKIKTIIGMEIIGQGIHTYDIDASELTNGIYYAYLTIGDKTKIRKILVSK